jgi:glucose-6-phosphate dehydrogenase assembly protein OpcA
MPAEAPCVLESANVPLEDIERELARLPQRLEQSPEHPVFRAHLSNLIVFCRGEEAAGRIAGEIPAIAAYHPARVLLLIGDRQPGAASVDASVCVRSHEAGSGQRVCTEQITLRAKGSGIDRLPYAVRELLIGDLPVNLWWAVSEPPPMAGSLLFDLQEQAQQIIYDSIGWPEPARGVVATASWLAQMESGGAKGRWRVVSDLNWRRLKYWRRLLGQALDPASLPGALESIHRVSIEHGPHAVIQAWELISWLAARLGWRLDAGRVQPGVEISWRFASPSREVDVVVRRMEQGPSAIRSLRIAYLSDGKPAELNFTVESEERLSVSLPNANAAPRTITVPPQSLAELVGRQLSDRERDPIFSQSMAVARILARSILPE